MAAINIGALLKYVAATKVKLARKAHTDKGMEVDGDERRQSSNMETLNAQGPSVRGDELMWFTTSLLYIHSVQLDLVLFRLTVIT